MLFAVHKWDLLPVTLFSSRRGKNILNILLQFMPIRFIPVRNADHLPDVRPFSADFFFLNNAVFYTEAPVVGPFFFDPQEIGRVMVFFYDRRIADQEICLKDICIR